MDLATENPIPASLPPAPASTGEANTALASDAAPLRMRIRFAKVGDLRLISHRDLARAFERMFRRAAVDVRQSEGFHPKPRMMFPAALGLGIVGLDEVCDVDLAQAVEPAELLDRLRREAPPGLELQSAAWVPAGARKAAVRQLSFELPVPDERADAARRAAQALLAQATCLATRPGRAAPVDLRATLVDLTIESGMLRLKLLATREAQARPRDILEVLGLADLETQGQLVRTRVELEGEPPTATG